MTANELIDRVTALTDACHAAYKRIPYYRLSEYSRTEMVAIEVRRLGLCGEQAAQQVPA